MAGEGEGATSTVKKVNNHFFASREGIQKLRLFARWDLRQCSIVDGGRDRVNWGCDAHRDPQRKSGDAIAVCVAEACRNSLIHFSGPGIDFCKQKLAREMLDWRGFFARANNFRFRLKKVVLFSPTPTCSTACCRAARSHSPCLCKGDR